MIIKNKDLPVLTDESDILLKHILSFGSSLSLIEMVIEFLIIFVLIKEMTDM